MTESVLIEPHYLPSLEYFCVIHSYENIVLERCEYFVKQTYRNRCYINTAHGVKVLTVPLVDRHGKIVVKDIRIEAGKQWRNNHWRAIESAYRKAPYFEFYSEELKEILYQPHEFLFDLNHNLLSFCLRHVGLQKNISASVTYEPMPGKNILDLRSLITDKKLFTLREFYRPRPYYQVFGNEFAPNLSLVDLLFCEGPGTVGILRASVGLANK